jgi:hypothetical protein
MNAREFTGLATTVNTGFITQIAQHADFMVGCVCVRTAPKELIVIVMTAEGKRVDDGCLKRVYDELRPNYDAAIQVHVRTGEVVLG